MRRLATQIHLTVVAVLLLFALLVGVAVSLGPGALHERRLAEGFAATAGTCCPGPGVPRRSCRGHSSASRRASGST